MIRKSCQHLKDANESYFEHQAVAVCYGMRCFAAGFAAGFASARPPPLFKDAALFSTLTGCFMVELNLKFEVR